MACFHDIAAAVMFACLSWMKSSAVSREAIKLMSIHKTLRFHKLIQVQDVRLNQSLWLQWNRTALHGTGSQAACIGTFQV